MDPMDQTFLSLFFIALGLISVIFFKPLARFGAWFQRHILFSPFSEKFWERFGQVNRVLIGGLLFVLGNLMLLRIIVIKGFH